LYEVSSIFWYWSRLSPLAQTLFDGGRRRAVSEWARANYVAAVEAYREISLTAFQEAEDRAATLRIIDNEGR
jgi:outer membrane protein TolC